MYDLIIRGAEICDGSGAPRARRRHRHRDGRIAAVGAVSGAARRELDADGLVAAPGLHRRAHPLRLPGLVGPGPDARRRGTASPSVVMGNCGFTHRALPARAPRAADGDAALRRGHADRGAARRHPLGVGDVPGVPRRRRTRATGDQRRGLRRPLARCATSSWATPPSSAPRLPTSWRACRTVVREAMRAGAIGFSTSESPTHFFGSGARCRAGSRRATRSSPSAAVLREFGRGIDRDRAAAPARRHRRQARRSGVLRRAGARRGPPGHLGAAARQPLRSRAAR